MKLFLRHILLWSTFFMALPLYGSKQEKEEVELGLLPGEKLIYSLRWGFIEVGRASIEVKGPMAYRDEDALEIKCIVRTNSWADTFYKVRDVMSSYTDLQASRTLGFTQSKREGKHRREVEVIIDWDEAIATRTNFGKPDGKPVKLEAGTFDPLSIVYGLRNWSFKIGETLSVPTTNGKRLVQTEVKVAKVKKLKVPAGKFNALLLKPDTKDLRGIFRKSKGAGIDLWVSNDSRRIPLMMKSKVSVGSFRIELVRIEGPDTDIPAMIEEKKKEAVRIRKR